MRFICAGIICITENEEVGDIWWDFNTNFIKDGADGIPYESPRIKINFWSDLEKTQKEWSVKIWKIQNIRLNTQLIL